MSLRARLVLGVIVLSSIGLATADVATYGSLRSFLVDRTDKSLQDSHVGAERAFEHGCDARSDRPVPGTAPGRFRRAANARRASALQPPVDGVPRFRAV